MGCAGTHVVGVSLLLQHALACQELVVRLARVLQRRPRRVRLRSLHTKVKVRAARRECIMKD